MREYIHFFEDSDLRDTYEYGSDYAEPYVSYTPVINEYEVQFNGEIVNEFKVKKIQGGYKISVPGHEIEEQEVLTNSDSFYFNYFFIFPEDLNLTEESTEFTFDGTIYYLVYEPSNVWNVYEDSEHTQEHGLISKLDIVSIPSSTSTDFVHYNKVTPPKSIYAKIYIEGAEVLTKGTSPLYVIISNRDDIFEKIIIDNGADVIDFSTLEEQTKFEDTNVYYQFNAYGTHNIEYVLKNEYAGIMPGGMIPSWYTTFDEITLPKGIYKIESGAFNNTIHTGNYLKLNIPDTINEVEDNAVVCIEISQEVTDLLLSINPNAFDLNCK